MYRVYTRERDRSSRGDRLPADRRRTRTLEQSWRRYAASCLWFSVLSMLLLYAMFRLQGHLPLNPVGLGAVDQYVSFNTVDQLHHQHELAGLRRRDHDDATSRQMLALTFQNFVSAAVGMAVLVALIRGFVALADATSSATSGATSSAGRLHPAAALGDRRRVARDAGRRADSRAQPSATASRGSSRRSPADPVAVQIAIKQLGTNGGGFFNVNSAHPFEGGVGGFGNFIEMFSILLIPAALTYTFGKMGRQRPARVGDLRGHAGPDGRRARADRSPGAQRVRGDGGRRRADQRPEPGGQGAPDRASTSRRCGRSPRPTPRTAA